MASTPPSRPDAPHGRDGTTRDAAVSEDAAAPTDAAVEEWSGTATLWRAGRSAWSVLGIVGVLVLAFFVAREVSLVLTALVLALFPATLLVPVASRLRRVMPNSVAALLTILLGLLVIVGVIGAMVPLVANEMPELIDSATEGINEVDAALQDGLFGVEFEGLSGLLELAQEQLGEFGDQLGATAGAAAGAAAQFLTGLLLMFVFLFFYLKDGERLSAGVIGVLPRHLHDRMHEASRRAWDTFGGYFRGQLTVALIDAVLIGIGLVIIGVPLAGPLAVLIFFGGLFPIVGAVTTGALAVLVALADAGLTTGLIVLGLVLLVQQFEGNVLAPVILGRSIELHALVVLIVITVGSLTYGILGAFLSVPIAATIARVFRYLRGPAPETEAARVADDGPTPTPA